MGKTIDYSDIVEIEDELQLAHVFYNGLRGKDHSSHMDSYMSLINWEKLEEMWAKLKDRFSQEQWVEIANYWRGQGYISPNSSVLYVYVFHKFGLKPDTSKDK